MLGTGLGPSYPEGPAGGVETQGPQKVTIQGQMLQDGGVESWGDLHVPQGKTGEGVGM